MRQTFFQFTFIAYAVIAGIGYFWSPILWLLIIVIPITLVGINDAFQTRQAIRRNFPVLGNFRYLLEAIRPEINQYFVESNKDGVPFSREARSIVYQRAKKAIDTLPFGTQVNVYDVGYEWVNHSMAPQHVDPASLRVTVGGPDCKKPYSASILNISAMSYGALSKNAVMALNWGAAQDNFAHNTGEGGLAEYHLMYGGDVIWQIGTGYFGARTHGGDFDGGLFHEKATLNNVKMIELKLSQGAKPGHGGILPAAKVTAEIAKIRNVPMGQSVLSPPAHTAFSNPIEMMHFIAKMRELSGGKPVGFKLCLGKRREFLALCKAMVETGITPDYIDVDGGEGGTGAAPLEFSNSVGSPLTEALIFVHNSLVGFSLRNRVKVICSGRIITGFDIIKNLSIGADMVYSARAMMMAIGCIQALRCNSNHCPTGVATQDKELMKGLVVEDKAKRVASYHRETIHSTAEILGAMGLSGTNQLRPWHRMRRTDFTEIKHYGEIYHFLSDGELLGSDIPKDYLRAMQGASSSSFAYSS